LENIIIKQNIRGEKQADKKPLIVVSICAVVLLVLGSLSNVIGYQSAKSTIASDSPLFSMRTQRATNQQQKTIRYQYLGMGKQNLFQFPIQNNKTEQLKKIIEFVSHMDEKTFHRFVVKIKNIIPQQDEMKDIDFNDIEQILHQLRDNSEMFQSYIGSDSESPTVLETPTGCWFPGCILAYLICIFVMIWSLLYTTGLVRYGVP
jgi:hypothetical protein